MTTQSKATTSEPESDASEVTAKAREDKSYTDGLAQTALRPTIRAAATIKEYSKAYGDLDLSELANELSSQVHALEDGDLTGAEAMLIAQAHTLDAIFNTMAINVSDGGYLKKLDLYLKLALRAQSQCRATWETVATIKNPPMVGYVGQANIAHGPQQVNNALAPAYAPSPALENETLQNELLEAKDGERLDFGAKSQACGADPAMAAVDSINRPSDTSG